MQRINYFDPSTSSGQRWAQYKVWKAVTIIVMAALVAILFIQLMPAVAAVPDGVGGMGSLSSSPLASEPAISQTVTDTIPFTLNKSRPDTWDWRATSAQPRREGPPSGPHVETLSPKSKDPSWRFSRQSELDVSRQRFTHTDLTSRRVEIQRAKPLDAAPEVTVNGTYDLWGYGAASERPARSSLQTRWRPSAQPSPPPQEPVTPSLPTGEPGLGLSPPGRMRSWESKPPAGPSAKMLVPVASASGTPALSSLSLSPEVDATLSLLSTEVSGPITGDTTWTLAGSPYLVTGNVLVNSGVRLTIEPGVEVRFNAGIALQIDGELIAQGTSGSPITFTSNAGASPGAWGYILFTDSSVDATYDGGGNYLSGSIIQYAVIEYAGGASLSDNGALRIDDSAPFVDHTTIRHSASNGIRAFNNGAPRMTYNTITDNAGRGISVNSTGTIEISHNTISDNDGEGIYNYGFYGTVTISDNTISGNSEGVYIYRSAATISDNTITGNNGRGINIEAHGVGVTISGNIITGNNGGGIYTWYGTVTISGNTITGNSASSGGGIDATQAAVTISDNTITGNTASGNGGGIHIFDGGIGGGAISRNTITGNTASGSGGGIDADGETISHNIIANNSASSGGGIYSGGTVSNNSILRNTAGNSAAAHYNGDGDFSSNTILDNVATGSGDLHAVYIEGHPAFNSNNIYGNTGYALYNGNAQGSANLDATNNWWGTTNDTDIQALICDWFDDSNLGIVDYIPYLSEHNTVAPISPPTGLAATPSIFTIDLSWNPNPESDLAGYKVYYDTDSGFPYDGTGANEGDSPIDVGNVNSFTLTGLMPGTTYYLAITAYDSDADGVDDWFDGNESWFSEEVIACVPYLRIRVNQSHDWVDACCGTPGATVWVTVTDSLGGLKGTAQATTDGDGCANAGMFTWSEPRPDIVVGDQVDASSSDGITAMATVIPITGQVDVEADTLSGHVLDVPYPATMQGEIWEEGATWPETQTDEFGNYLLDFSPFDILPGMGVAAWHIQPDGNWVGSVFQEAAPHLSIKKWADGSPGEGGNFVVHVQYRNDGDADAENTVITDTMLGGMTYIADTSGFPHTGSGSGPIVWDMGTVEPGDWSQFDVFVEVTAVESDTITNTVQIATSNPYDQGDPEEKESTWSEHVEANDTHLSVGKWAWTGDPAPDTDYVYTVDVCNNGSTSSSEVTITDTLHPSTTLQTWWSEHPGWTEVASSSHQLVLSRPLIPGYWCGHVYLRVHLDAAAWPGMYITNTAVISASNDLEDDDNEAFWDGKVSEPHTNVYINKHWGWGQLVPGGKASYNTDFGNNGNVPVTTTIRITDTLPVSTTFNQAWLHDNQRMTFPITPTVVTGDYVVWEVDGIDNGYNVGFGVELNVDGDADPGTVLTNTVEISPQPDEDNCDDNASTVVETLHDYGPNLRVSKGHWWNDDWGLYYKLHFENIGDQTAYNVLVTDTYPISTSFNGEWYHWYGENINFTDNYTDSQVIWELDRLEPGWSTGVGFNVDLDMPGQRLRWYTNTVEITTLPADTNPADNTYTDVAFSGGEVDWVDLDVGDNGIWGCAPDGPITITTAYVQMFIGNNCFNLWFDDPFQSGDVVTIAAGSGTQPVVIHVPDPFTAYASSITDTVWGQIDHLDHEWVEVDLDGGPTQNVQTDGSGNYSATFADLPRGGQGEVRYNTEIDYADVTFHHRFQTQDLIMNVNYGHDWVEGNYEAGHTLWITVTESDGFTIKATAELETQVIPWWGGRTGFSTNLDDPWVPDQPDIVAGDWVYGLVDNGYSSTVRVGTINGEVDVDADTVSGTIHANWFTQMLNADCGVWEENGPGRDFTVDPDGGSYFCDFSSDWDLLPGQNVGVEYQEPDGDWVINVFFVPYEPYVRVNQSHEWVDGRTRWPDTGVWVTVRDSDGHAKGWEVTTSDGNAWFHGINIHDEHGHTVDIVPGDTVEVQMEGESLTSIPVITMSGEVDADTNTVFGNIPAVPINSTVRVEVWENDGPPDQETLTDGLGDYQVDFSPFDLQSGHMVGIWYVNPDGNQVGIVRHALRLSVHTARDEVEGETWTNVPVTVVVNGGETAITTSDEEGYFWTEFSADIIANDTVEAWAGTGTQYVSLDVELISANVDDASDTVWGYGPPDARLEVEVEGDWRETFTDDSGYYEITYDWDIGPWNNVHVEYYYPDGHETYYDFGPSDVGVDKWARPWNVVPGDEFSYFIRYWNSSDAPASDVVITDTLPDHVAYQWDSSGATPTIDPETNTLVWNLGTLAAHRERTFELRVRMDADAPLWENFQNWVEISDPDDSDPGDNEEDAWVRTEEPSVDVEIDKWLDDGRAFAGAELTYVLDYENQGSRTAHDVIVTDTLPIHTAFVDTDFEVGVDGISEWVDEPAGLVVWDIGALEPGESQDFQLTVRVLEGTPPGTLLVNQAEISTSDEDDWSGNDWDVDTQVVEPYVPDLWVEKWVESDVSSLDHDVTYRIEYYNDGPADAHNVVLTDTVPVSMTHLSHSAWTPAVVSEANPSGDQVIWELGTVAAGHGGHLYLTTRIEQPVAVGTVFTNTVDISTTDAETDYVNNNYVDVLGAPRVICVPWVGTHPHRIWSGLTTTLKGTAKGYGLATYEWDPGDGSPVYSGLVGDPYVIEESHAYSAPVGTVYTATLTVWGAFGWSDTDTYTVQVFNPTHGVEVDVAIDEGLWYIHSEANRYSSGGLPFAEWQTSGYGVAETASAIQAFQVQGHRPGGDPWEDPYVENVRRGWNALFTYANLDAMTIQPAGDPDGDGDGAGIGIYDDYNHSIYEAGLAMMALATTGSPGRVAHTGPPIYVHGQTYASIAQDMADWFAWGQNDDWSGWARGGWRYRPNSGDSDNSNTQFPVLGLAAAEHTWGITVPPWVKDELRDYWLAYTQNPASGGFGYTDPDGWVNVGKTGAGIMSLAWTGVPVSDTRTIAAAQYIEAQWYDLPDGNWNGNVGEFYAMYAVKKGSQLAAIHHYGPHFWQYEYSSYLVGVQWPDGSFDDAGNMGVWQPMNTSWAIMILSPGLYRPLPWPIIPPIHYGGIGTEWSDGEVLFDASESHHTDPDREIVLYEWDFGDGSPVETTPDPIITHTYAARGAYAATLTVWDDAGNSATAVTLVNITAPDNPPVADPDGPYVGPVGEPLTLDGSASYDPDEWMGDAVVLYEWDISGGSIHTTTEPTLVYTWPTAGTFPVTLRVRDRGADYGLDSPKWSTPVETTVTVREPIIIHVDHSNDTGWEDGTQEHPYDTIVEGLDAAIDGDTILVAQGTYTENITVDREITLEGGYASYTSPDSWTRDIALYETIIDGSNSQTVVGDWDGDQTVYPMVIEDSGTRKMWYIGVDLYGVRRIGYATSPDGINWTKYGSNPVLDVGADGEWDAAELEVPCVIKESATSYKMWYSGRDTDGDWRIGYATSNDGVHWTKYESNPILEPGSETWKNVGVLHPSVTYEDSLYKMWLLTLGDDGSGLTTYTVYATSPDGVNWTWDAANPLFGRDWESWFWRPNVLHIGSEYEMWYTVRAGETQVGYATSPDETTWTKQGSVLTGTVGEWDEGHAVDPHVLYEGGVYTMWYDNHNAIGIVTATNGINWTKFLDHPVLVPGAPGQWGQPVVALVGGSDGAVLDGFTVTEGDGQGGIVIDGTAATIANCTAFNNNNQADWGGGIHVNNGATAVISHTMVISNVSGSAGGLGVLHDSVVTLLNSVVRDNWTTWGAGGGIGLWWNSTLTVSDSIISSNTTPSIGGGIEVSTESSVVLNNTHITHNTADNYGGGIVVHEGSSAVITGSQIYANTAVSGEGGGLVLYDNDSSLNLASSWVVANAALNNEGGGISVGDGGSATIENSIIAGNTAGTHGGGFWFSSGGPYRIMNSHIVGNETPGEGAALAASYSVQVEVINTLVISNSGNTGIADRDGSGSVFLLNHCDTYGNSPDGTVGVTISRTNCLGTPPEDGLDPLMSGGALPGGVGPAFAEQWLSYDYHLQAGSPAIDAGTADGAPDHDFEDDPRPWGLGVDMGADEYYASAVISEVRVTNVRDTSFTVSWITDIPSGGRVNYGTDPANLNQTASDDRGAGTFDDTHYVTLEELLPNTTYYFDVVSGGTTDDNEGAHYAVTTGPTLDLPTVDTIYGQVFKEDEVTPAEGAMVYITLFDDDGSGSADEAAPLSALVDDTGYWYANLGNARTSDLSAYFTYSASGDKLKLEAQGAADGTGYEPAVDTANDTPAPTIYLSHTVIWEISIQVGWNHISLPLDPLTPYTAESVCDEIISQGGDVAEIDRWHASGWDGHICGLPFNDFDLELGADYFIKSSAASIWTIEGYRVTTPVPLDLQIGWNSIGIPHTDAYTAESLCEDINDQCGEGVAVEVDRWHASGWDGHICGLPFNNFDIEIGTGYFVKASGNCTVTPSLAALSGRWRMEDGDWRMENGGWRLDFQHPTSNFHHPTSITGVKVTNVRDTSFTVSWSMDVMATGWVNYGTSPALGQTAYDDRGVDTIGQSHHVTLQGLAPLTTYYFEVVSGATMDDNRGGYYQATTGPTLDLPASHSIYGRVFESDGITPAEGAIVYVTLRGADDVGSPGEAEVMSALVDSEGWWQANLGNARLAHGKGYFTYSAAGDTVVLMVRGPADGFVSRTVDTGDLGSAVLLTLVRQRRPYLPPVVKE